MAPDILSLLKGNNKVSKPERRDVNPAVYKPERREVKPAISSISKLPQPKMNTISKNNDEAWKIYGAHLLTKIPNNKTEIVKKEELKKVAAFDLDGTLIKTKSGHTFARGSFDWQWFNNKVVSQVIDLHDQGYVIAIFTNQSSVIAHEDQVEPSKSYVTFTKKLDMILAQLEEYAGRESKKNGNVKFQVFLYASTKLPIVSKKNKRSGVTKLQELIAYEEAQYALMRKPGPGMWNELVSDLQARGISVDVEGSFFVGDAAGRPNDFLDCDIKLAEGLGIGFKTPEEIFK